MSETTAVACGSHGKSWSKWSSVCKGMPVEACGGAVGPGVGIQLQQGPKKGRLLFIGHYGVCDTCSDRSA
eukprot:SAG11_NODE_157_length_14147_cov_8.545202_21_plen_70_part_00